MAAQQGFTASAATAPRGPTAAAAHALRGVAAAGARRGAAAAEPASEPLVRMVGRIRQGLAATVALVGAGHLAAWLAGAMAVRGGSAITMKANAALCLLLLGSALLLEGPGVGAGRRAAARLLAGLAAVVGALTLGENLTGWDLGLDQLLAAEAPGAMGVLFPNRMGTPASTSVLALGVGLLLAGRPGARAARWAQGLAVTACVVGGLTTLGYLYGAHWLYGVARVTAIAWPTALSLLALGVALLLARPAEGFAGLLTADGPGGTAVRRLILPVVALPVALGWLEMRGERAGVFDSAMGTALSMVAFVVSLSALTLLAGRRVGKVASQLRAQKDALAESESKLRGSFANASIGFAITSPDGRFLDANPAYCKLTGYDVGDLRTMGFQQLIHPDDAAANLALIGRMLAGEIPDFVVENRYTRRDGAAVWVRKSVSLARTATGEPGWIIALVEDVTERRRAEEALRHRELVVQQSRDIILFMRREDGRILEANPAATRAYGYGRDELLALTIHDLRAPGTRALVPDQMRDADAGGVLFETVHRRKDGSTFPVEVSSRGATVGEGRMLVSVVRDISERRRAEAREREQRERAERRAAELDAVVDSIAEPLLVTDADGKVARANPAFERVFGPYAAWDVAERLRRGGLETADGQPVEARTPGARALSGETVHGVLQRLRLPDGTVLHLSTSAAPIRTADGVVGAVEVFADVTEQQRAAEALREADRRKTEFLAVLSHELRNPLAPIRNSIAVMERAPGSEAAERAREVLRRQTDHLSRLVDDLLDLTRITHGKIDLRLARLDVREIVRQAAADARGLFEQRGVALTLVEGDEPSWVEADAARLAQMVGNLLANALKFTPPGGQVRVAVARKDAVCEVRVRDTGIGIERADLRRIFEPFVQVERTRRTHGGLGIGLALVREMALKHGGSVRAESDGLGRGAELVIELPLAGAPAARGGDASPERALGPLSVLIVEDNVDAGETLAELLTLSGHRASTVATGREGLASIAGSPPDVLVCDIGLPDVSGYDVIRALRAMPEGGRVFAVALTGYAQPRDREEALAAGFDAHLPKPPPLAELEAMLGAVSRRRG